jgi:nickel-dependent lactate racemase
MFQNLCYGDRGILDVDISESMLDAEFSAITPAPLEDPAAAMAGAVAEPLGFPPLCRTLVPGDQVAIALDRNVPCGGQLIAGLLNLLSESGQLQQCQLRLVFSGSPKELAQLQLEQEVPADQLQQLTTEIHQPDDAHQLSYLAAARDGTPIYINRTLCDADVVLPIVTLGLDGQLGYAGIHGSLFHAFTDTRTRQRFLVPGNHGSGQLQEDADEAAWLLGIQIVLGVVPGAGNSLLHVIAGNTHELRAEAELRGRAAWSRPARQAELVIATIGARPESQGWIHLARALHSASQLVTENGMIVLCTELACPPGAALYQRADQADNRPAPATGTDALAAEQLDLAGQRARVYLLSRLNQDVVEGLGIAHVSEAKQVTRLGSQCDSCIVLAEADRTVIEKLPLP